MSSGLCPRVYYNPQHKLQLDRFCLSSLYMYITLVMGFPGGAQGKESACQHRRHKRYGFIPGPGRAPQKGMAVHSGVLA